MNKRNNLIIAGVTGVAFILFIIFIYLPYADKQDNLNKVKESYQHSSYLRDSLNHIPDFTCVDQNGKTFTKADVEGTVFVADFFIPNVKVIARLQPDIYHMFKIH